MKGNDMDTAFCRGISDGFWYEYDDSAVTRIPESRIQARSLKKTLLPAALRARLLSQKQQARPMNTTIPPPTVTHLSQMLKVAIDEITKDSHSASNEYAVQIAPRCLLTDIQYANNISLQGFDGMSGEQSPEMCGHGASISQRISPVHEIVVQSTEKESGQSASVCERLQHGIHIASVAKISQTGGSEMTRGKLG
ncbi:hypothetical protein T265_04750 [Opisthorchis viverrini]|uniref:Uncharacterized protein n=1 Tax=Opisthorchis viverrini TaxID=6198 RepID=A0A074ZMT3_OPIVI|nr:hypothetical protein T265_04750 [Opisthorchis viverrini]KER28446.1 hypothetical protein T265_04750 [Opisthorchis viverrini]